MKRKKVLIAMSGGVDSSVAALLMKKKGYDVVGVFLKCYSDSKNVFGRCSWKDERKSALMIASSLDIPLTTLDYEKEYKEFVIDEMFEMYKKGITPNPDVDCNIKIKFPFLLDYAKKINADYVVTGHYSRIREENETYKLLRAKDELKDQSYFLYRLNQKYLSKVLFPIGDLTKKQVREIAKKNNFPNYDKKSTVGICFIGKINFNEFLKKNIEKKKGIIVDPSGNILGEHDGVFYYNVGMRLGPRVGIDLIKEKGKKPVRWYVAKKDVEKNVLVVAPEDHEMLFRKEILIKDLSLTSLNKNEFLKKAKKGIKLKCRIRNVGELLPCKVFYQNYKLTLVLDKAIDGISEGQAVVLYSGKVVLGGGVIG